MPVLDRHVFIEWLKIFAMTTAALVGLLLVGAVYDQMPEFIQWRTSGVTVAEYFLLLIPGMTPVIMPVCVLVSLLFILGHFHKNQEITAMRAAGLSVWRITRTLWAGGVLCAVALLAVNTLVAPLSTQAARTMRERAEFEARRRTERDAPADRFSGVLFDNGVARRRWRIESLGAYTGRAIGVRVFELREDGAPSRQILADAARFDAARGRWIFERGRDIRYAADGPEILGQRAFEVLEEPGYEERPLPMLLATKKPSELSITEIRTLLSLAGDADPVRRASLEVRFHSLIAGAFSCLIVVGLAIPFAIAGVRVNPMVGVSKALGLYAGYYALDRVGYALGSQQVLPAPLAAWLPNVAALAFAAWLCRRVN